VKGSGRGQFNWEGNVAVGVGEVSDENVGGPKGESGIKRGKSQIQVAQTGAWVGRELCLFGETRRMEKTG